MNGHHSLCKPEPKVLLDLCHAGDEEHEALEELPQEATANGVGHPPTTHHLPSWLKRYVGMDTDTATVRSFENEVIPGLLQTGDPGRRVHAVAVHLVTPELDRFVAARKRRQSLLTDDETGRVRLIAANETPHPARSGGAVLIEASSSVM